MECQFSSFTNSNMIRKDPIFKTLMLSRKGLHILLFFNQFIEYQIKKILNSVK